MCRRFFKHDHEAIESVNDGMMKVFSRIADYQSEKGRFFNWVYTIVRNTALDKLEGFVEARRTGRAYWKRLVKNLPELAADHNPVAALERKDLFTLLDELNPATRAVCNLY